MILKVSVFVFIVLVGGALSGETEIFLIDYYAISYTVRKLIIILN